MSQKRLKQLSQKPLEHMIDAMLDECDGADQKDQELAQDNVIKLPGLAALNKPENDELLPRDKQEQVEMESEVLEIRLKDECTIYEVSEWQNQIIQLWPEQKQVLHINLADVTDIDACFVQLLLSCQKTAELNGSHCYIDDIPKDIAERFSSMHVFEQE